MSYLDDHMLHWIYGDSRGLQPMKEENALL